MATNESPTDLLYKYHLIIIARCGKALYFVINGSLRILVASPVGPLILGSDCAGAMTDLSLLSVRMLFCWLWHDTASTRHHCGCLMC